jgi:hypothetical protein
LTIECDAFRDSRGDARTVKTLADSFNDAWRAERPWVGADHPTVGGIGHGPLAQKLGASVHVAEAAGDERPEDPDEE